MGRIPSFKFCNLTLRVFASIDRAKFGSYVESEENIMTFAYVLLEFIFCDLYQLTVFAKPRNVYSVVGSRIEMPAKSDWSVYGNIISKINLRTKRRSTSTKM